MPSGDIVAIELRNEVLTGFTTIANGGRVQQTQKWWKQIKSTVDYQGCEGYEDETISQTDVYYGFKPDGTLYARSDNTEYYHTTWKWATSKKDAIVLEEYPDVEFKMTSLNDSQVVYATFQPQGSGCNVVTWEQFGSPVLE